MSEAELRLMIDQLLERVSQLEAEIEAIKEWAYDRFGEVPK